MILLIVGAIISSLIIPYYTRQWQDHQKELELKTNLSDEINKAISDVTVAADYRLSSPNGTGIGIIKNWDVSKAMISSKIKAYFSDTQLTRNWENLSSAVSALYEIVGPLPPRNDTTYNYYFCGRFGPLGTMYESYPQSGPMNIVDTEIILHQCDKYTYIGIENLQNVEKYFPASSRGIIVRNDTVDWNSLLHVDSNTTYKNFNRSYDILEKHIEAHTQQLLDAIFKSPITVFE